MIAIIDDDLAVRKAMQSLLHSLGYVTEAFASADNFLRSPDRHKVSCVITDVHMPGMNGLALQKRLIADKQNAPIIFITGFPDKSTREQALSAGAHGFLTKPCTQRSLISSIESALQARL